MFSYIIDSSFASQYLFWFIGIQNNLNLSQKEKFNSKKVNFLSYKNFMIELKEINKIYTSKNANVTALKNINAVFSDTGCVFVLGKSGSGKSTLLNIIGLLDSSSSGQLRINNVVIQECDNIMLDSLRKNHIGFVFQDSNLIRNLNIYENISLSINNQDKSKKDEVIRTTLSAVDLEGYGNRYPNQLSGGEKQRVAIARALARNSNIILVDEPTGNLDEETGDTIFKILKDLSKDRLVIIVTHDKDSCIKFADRIITLKDGEITEDEVINISNLKEKNGFNISTETGEINFNTKLKLALSNIKSAFLRSTLSLFVLFLSMVVTTGMLSTFLYTTEGGIIQTAIHNDLQYLHFYDTEYNRYLDIEKTHELIDKNTLDYLIDFNPYESIINKETKIAMTGGLIQYKLNCFSVIEETNDISRIGLELYPGYEEIDSNSIIVSDLSVDFMSYSTQSFLANSSDIDYLYFIYVSEQEIPLNINDYDYEDLIGLEFRQYEINDYIGETGAYFSFEIAGVYKTYYKQVMQGDFDYLNDLSEDDLENWIQKWKHIYKTYINNEYLHSNTIIPGYFYNDITIIKHTLNSISLNEMNYNLNVYDSSSGNLNSDENIALRDILFSDLGDGVIINESGLVDLNTLDSNSVIINLEIYNKLKNTNFVSSDFVLDDVIIQYPSIIGESIVISIKDSNSDTILHNKEFIISGVYIKNSSFGFSVLNNYNIYIQNSDFSDYLDLYYGNADVITVYLNNDYSSLEDFLEEFSKSNLYPEFDYSYSFYSLETGIRQMKTYITIISIILVIVAFIMMSNFIVSSVKDNKKEIGVLRSLGFTAKDIFWIILIEALLFGFVVLILLVVSQPLIIDLLNRIIAKDEYRNIKFFDIKLLPMVISAVITVIIPLIGSGFASKYLSRLSPVDCIRE